VCYPYEPLSTGHVWALYNATSVKEKELYQVLLHLHFTFKFRYQVIFIVCILVSISDHVWCTILMQWFCSQLLNRLCQPLKQKRLADRWTNSTVGAVIQANVPKACFIRPCDVYCAVLSTIPKRIFCRWFATRRLRRRVVVVISNNKKITHYY